MTRTLLWGLWQRGRWHLVALGCGLTVFVALFLRVVRPEDPGWRTDLGHRLLGIAVLLLVFNLLHLVEGRTGGGFDARLFVLPISSLRLAATWILTLSGVVITVYGLGGLAIAVWYDVPGPTIVGGVLIAAFFATLMCVFWASPDRAGLRNLLLGGLAVGWLAPAMFLHGSGVAIRSRPTLETVGVGGFVGALLLYLVSIPTGSWALSRHRRGDAASARRSREAVDERPGLVGRRRRGGGFGALLWLDVREKGRLLPSLLAAPWLFVVAARWTGAMDDGVILRMIGAMVLGAFFFGPVMAAGIVCRLQEGVIGSRLDDLRTLRPISSATLAAVFLVHGVLSLLFVWTLTLAAAWTMTRWIAGADGVPATFPALTRLLASPEAGSSLAVLALGLIILAWLQIGVLSTLLLTGRNTAAALLIFLPYLVGAALLVFRDSITRLPSPALLGAAPWVIGTAGTLLTAAAAMLALRRGLVRPSTMAYQALAAIVLFGYLALELDLVASSHGFAVFGAVLAMVAVWPAASLAVRWNRHR